MPFKISPSPPLLQYTYVFDLSRENRKNPPIIITFSPVFHWKIIYLPISLTYEWMIMCCSLTFFFWRTRIPFLDLQKIYERQTVSRQRVRLWSMESLSTGTKNVWNKWIFIYVLIKVAWGCHVAVNEKKKWMKQVNGEYSCNYHSIYKIHLSNHLLQHVGTVFPFLSKQPKHFLTRDF